MSSDSTIEQGFGILVIERTNCLVNSPKCIAVEIAHPVPDERVVVHAMRLLEVHDGVSGFARAILLHLDNR